MTKEERREYNRKYRQANKEKIAEQQKEWREANKNKIAEYQKEYHQANRERILEYQKEYYQENREKILEYHKEYLKEYRNTPMGRALYILGNYNLSDRKYNRGQGDLTAEWIVENIFSKPCKHCGKTDWHELGCNRLDNSKPHSKDNVEPCCEECNVKLPRKKSDN